MQTIRTFVAINVPVTVCKRAAELIRVLESSGADVKWVDPARLHVTLKFLGDVPNVEIPAVCQAVAEACADVEPFSFLLGGAGAFPNPLRPRTIWIGVTEGHELVADLQERIDVRLAHERFPREHRRFQGHLTIGRVRRGGPDQQRLAELLTEHADFPVGDADADEVIVYSSTLERSGPVYDALSTVPLGGA